MASGGGGNQGGISLAVGHLASQEGGPCSVVTSQRIHNHTHHKRQRKLSIVSQAALVPIVLEIERHQILADPLQLFAKNKYEHKGLIIIQIHYLLQVTESAVLHLLLKRKFYLHYEFLKNQFLGILIHHL